jgi:hypothetical protein
VGLVWFIIEALGLRPACAALQPLGCNPRLRPTKPTAFFFASSWQFLPDLEILWLRCLPILPPLPDTNSPAFPFFTRATSTDFFDVRGNFTQPSCLGDSAHCSIER